jgi:hypothetical protein
MNANVYIAITLLTVIQALFSAPKECLSAEFKVADATALRNALAEAQPGDSIVLKAGTYEMGERTPETVSDGTAAKPITMRAAGDHGYAILKLDGNLGFRVKNQFWKFEGIHFKGNPERSQATLFLDGPQGCDNVSFVDCKISDSAGYGMKTARDPKSAVDRIVIEFTEVFNTGGTAVDVVGGDDWIVRRNYVHAFGTHGGTNYGIFLKGGGTNGLIEGNLVDGERQPGSIGISFGGGLTGKQFMPSVDGQSPAEHKHGICRNNIVVNTSDVAYHSNNADSCAFYNNLAFGCDGFQRQKSQGTDPLFINNAVGKLRGALDSSAANMEAGQAEWFQNPAKYDFRLTEIGESKLTQSAKPVDENPTDFFGNARDKDRPVSGPILPGAKEARVWQDRRS